MPPNPPFGSFCRISESYVSPPKDGGQSLVDALFPRQGFLNLRQVWPSPAAGYRPAPRRQRSLSASIANASVSPPLRNRAEELSRDDGLKEVNDEKG
jgi:hypothetical protein